MFEIYQSEKTQKFHFRLKARNGEIILTGQAYKDKAGCENGVASVKKNGVDEAKFEIKDSTNGKQYFVLKSGNGQIIGQSQMYNCLLYTSPSPRDLSTSRMPSSA